MLKVLVVEDEELIRRGIVLAVDWAALGCVVAVSYTHLDVYKRQGCPLAAPLLADGVAYHGAERAGEQRAAYADPDGTLVGVPDCVIV